MGKVMAVANLLIDLEYELRVMQLWENVPPSEKAMASVEPFCIDTLTFPQWLQWVFLPRMHQLVDAQGPLPEKCEITPMAEEYFRHHPTPNPQILGVLQGIDQTLTESADNKLEN